MPSSPTANERLGLVRSALLSAAFLLAGCHQAQAEPGSPATVSADFRFTNADLANPERGFYQAADTDLDALGAALVAQVYAKGERLIYARINLEPYRDSDLPLAFLDRLDAAFETARRGGVKLIVRATYNYPRGETQYRDAQDASLPRVLAHLAQLKPLLQRNEDVIAFMQAGFIGAWGEWHTSSNDLTTAESRTRIKDALLDAAPASRSVQFRYPPYIQAWAPRLPGLDAALDGSFRVGFHNDCFLASDTDVGTYDDRADVRDRQRKYMDTLGDLAPFGGETCNPADDPSPRPRTACADILGEGARFNLTYLNDGYYRRLFHDNWRRQGCMDEVRRRMGYRFGLVRVSHPAAIAQGGALSVSVVVRNAGWARLYNPRSVVILLRDRKSGGVRRLEARGTDPRRWLPGADTSETLTVTVPGDVLGVQEVWLALPDPGPRLKDDPRFAIRLANADDGVKGQEWDQQRGAFELGTAVEVVRK
uniref:DUF4832 domain-containing protein n=1 Tax=Caulobacter sp. (strain K31) TaxID=366602 RepID=B0T4F9_CAUSK